MILLIAMPKAVTPAITLNVHVSACDRRWAGPLEPARLAIVWPTSGNFALGFSGEDAAKCWAMVPNLASLNLLHDLFGYRGRWNGRIKSVRIHCRGLEQSSHHRIPLFLIEN